MFGLLIQLCFAIMLLGALIGAVSSVVGFFVDVMTSPSYKPEPPKIPQPKPRCTTIEEDREASKRYPF